jgi:flagellar hook-associated protein 3 FlgL
MRISTSQFYIQSANDMMSVQERLQTAQMQTSSGKRINKPSDDPVGASKTLVLESQEFAYTQYQRNINSASNRLQQEEAAYKELEQLMDRVKVLALQAANTGTSTKQTRVGAAAEAREIEAEMLRLANLKDANGEYIFAGLEVFQQPYEQVGGPNKKATNDPGGLGRIRYHGDDQQRYMDIDPTRRLPYTDPGSETYGDKYNKSIFGTMDGLIKAFETDNTMDGGPSGTSSLELNRQINQLISNLDKQSKDVVATHASVGARLQALNEEERLNTTLQVQTVTTRSGIESVDFAQAATNLTLETTALQASQLAFVQVRGLSLFNYLGSAR